MDTSKFHSLLKRQLKRQFGSFDFDQFPVEFLQFIETVNQSYHHFDDDRYMLERSLELSSQELLEASSKMHAMLAAFPDLLLIAEKNGTIIHFNTRRMTNLFAPPETFLNKKIQDVLPADVGKLYEQAFAHQNDSLEYHKIEYWLMMPRGRQYFEARLIPFPDNRIFIIIREVTDRKNAEDNLKTYAEKLEQSNRALKDFAYIASHDLQEPLRKIQTFGDRLREKCTANLGEEGNDYLYRMQNAAERMQTLIIDLLTYSQVTTKNDPLVAVNLVEIINQVLSDLEISIEKVSGKIHISDLPTIEADPVQMRQLFQNLIGNALKFHRKNVSPEIRIYTIRPSEPGWQEQWSRNEYSQIIVEDNGIGFKEEYLDTIFTIFQRLHNRSEYEGTGVGLPICQKIVERHGGYLTAKSIVGQGSKFIIVLPLSQLIGGKIRE